MIKSNTEILYKIIGSNGKLLGYSEANNNRYGIYCNQTINGGLNNLSSGSFTTIGGGESNSIIKKHSVIGGGKNNSIQCSSEEGFSTIVGGICNKILGDYSSIVGGFSNSIGEANDSFIGGGRLNIITGRNGDLGGAVINGGCENFISGWASIIGGGYCNRLRGIYSTIAGGAVNCISGYSSFIAGGVSNIVSGLQSSIGGGYLNKIISENSFIGGGAANTIRGLFACRNFIGAGQWNILEGNNQFSFIGGGSANCISGVVGEDINSYNASYSFIGGGDQNKILGRTSYGLISEGNRNCIRSTDSTQERYVVISNGECNLVEGSNSTILNGVCNAIYFGFGYFGSRSCHNQILNGDYNSISGGRYGSIINGAQNSGMSSSFIGGGYRNQALPQDGPADSAGLASIINGYQNITSGGLSFIAGGVCNSIGILGTRSNIIGSYGSVNYEGATLITDGQNRLKASPGEHTLTLDFASGIILNSRAPSSSSSAGHSGQLAFDRDYIYRHNGLRWTRTAMSVW